MTTTKKTPIKKAVKKKVFVKKTVTKIETSKEDLAKVELTADLVNKIEFLNLTKLADYYINQCENLSIEQIKGLIIFFTPDEL